MATDYEGLARLSQPRMMPDATYGIGLFAGMDYQNQQAAHQQDINQARGLAALGAEMDQQKHREYMAGAPMRAKEAELKSKQTEFNLANLPKEQEEATAKRDASIAEARQKKMKAVDDTLTPYLEEWMQATTPRGKQDVLENMRKAGITHIGARSLDNIDIDSLDEAIQRRYGAKRNSIAHLQKKDLEDEKTARAMAVAQEQARSRENVARIKAEADKFKAEAASLKPETLGQWEAKMREKMAKGEMTAQEEAGFNKYIADKYFVAMAREGNKPPTVDPKIFPPGVMKPVDPPKVPSIPPQKGPTNVPSKQGVNKADIAGQASKNGKTFYQLKDGRMIDEQGNEVDQFGNPKKK